MRSYKVDVSNDTNYIHQPTWLLFTFQNLKIQSTVHIIYKLYFQSTGASGVRKLQSRRTINWSHSCYDNPTGSAGYWMWGRYDGLTSGQQCSTWWRHDMKTFSAKLTDPLWGKSTRGPVDSPRIRPMKRSFKFSLFFATNCCINNRIVDELRRHALMWQGYNVCLSWWRHQMETFSA